jgi:hypothetical protein
VPWDTPCLSSEQRLRAGKSEEGRRPPVGCLFWLRSNSEIHPTQQTSFKEVCCGDLRMVLISILRNTIQLRYLKTVFF